MSFFAKFSHPLQCYFFRLVQLYKIVAMPKRKMKFAELWLRNPDYLAWLSKRSDGLAYCSYCCKEIDISNMGESSLKSHMKSKKCLEREPCKSGTRFFKPVERKSGEESANSTKDQPQEDSSTLTQKSSYRFLYRTRCCHYCRNKMDTESCSVQLLPTLM